VFCLFQRGHGKQQNISDLAHHVDEYGIFHWKRGRARTNAKHAEMNTIKEN